MPYLPCLNTSTLRPASLFDKIDAAAQAGFKAIERWNGEIDDFIAGGGTFRQVKDRIDCQGLAFHTSLHSFLSVSRHQRRSAS
jgi:2-keto-myo-inositol isomerase